MLARAMQRSKTLVSLTISIRAFRFQEARLDSALAVSELLRTNKTIQFLCFKSMGRHSLHQVGDRDLMADALFDGLAESSLVHFVYANESPVMNDNQQKAYDAIQSNPHLRRVDAVFASPMGGQLKKAIADKSKKRVDMWLKEDTANENHLAILDDILSSFRYEDKVTALYSYLRCWPSLVLF